MVGLCFTVREACEEDFIGASLAIATVIAYVLGAPTFGSQSASPNKSDQAKAGRPAET